MKPRYRVPSMAEIASAPANGLTMVSTFSGCGGTCLGFRMAGYRVLWANDSDAHAQETYRVNHPETVLDPRDIRAITAHEILQATQLQVGELDVFEGSPPCTVFSMMGHRSRKWGGVAEHARAMNVNIEDLFFEWLWLLEGLQPRTFVAENVAGLVKGVAKGHFKEILRRMRGLGYRVEARLLDAQWLGVPQARQRVIFIGVRGDLPITPTFPPPHAWRYTLRDVLPTTVYIETPSEFGCIDRFADRPAPTIISSSGSWLVRHESGAVRKLTIAEAKRLCSFPEDFSLNGPISHQWMRLGNSVPPLMARAIAATLRDALSDVDHVRDAA